VELFSWFTYYSILIASGNLDGDWIHSVALKACLHPHDNKRCHVEINKINIKDACCRAWTLDKASTSREFFDDEKNPTILTFTNGINQKIINPGKHCVPEEQPKPHKHAVIREKSPSYWRQNSKRECGLSA
jgi:hypothetical protein